MLSRKLRPTSHSESEGSSSTVSLSDDDLELMSCESPQPCNGPTLVSFTELEASSQNSSVESESGEDSMAGDKPVTERDFQQHLSLLKCRFRAELDKIDDEVMPLYVLFPLRPETSDRSSRELLLRDKEDSSGFYSEGPARVQGT